MIWNIFIPVTGKGWLPESVRKEMKGDAYVAQIAILPTGFYMWYCRWQFTIYTLGFSVFTSVQLRFSSFFLVIFTSESGNLLTYKKNNHFLSSLERPMKTSWRNTASRHRDRVHVYDKWPVWGYFRVDQPTSTCFKWHTSISVYLQRTSDRSNSHERRCSTRNLDDMHTIWGICL